MNKRMTKGYIHTSNTKLQDTPTFRSGTNEEKPEGSEGTENKTGRNPSIHDVMETRREIFQREQN